MPKYDVFIIFQFMLRNCILRPIFYYLNAFDAVVKSNSFCVEFFIRIDLSKLAFMTQYQLKYENCH